ncbi:hypothetical protein GX441_11365 [bacterium]|nr:hypothetical protein [bacterium]
MSASGYERGFNIPSWSEDGYANAGFKKSLRELKICGADSAALVPTWHQKNIFSSRICRTTRTASDASLAEAIEKARSLGFKLMLKPHLEVEDGSFRASIFPFARNEWFKSYAEMILHYAGISREFEIERLCIGTELPIMMHGNWTHHIIKEIRSVYCGEITFAVNWYALRRPGFWHLLDYIGVDFYASLALRDGDDDYARNLEPWLERIEEVSKEYKKPVILTEIGYRSFEGAARRPWDWKSRGRSDQELQAKCYRTFLEAVEQRPWLKAVYFWLWNLNPADITATGYSPQGKEAEKVLRKFWCEGKMNRRPYK